MDSHLIPCPGFVMEPPYRRNKKAKAAIHPCWPESQKKRRNTNKQYLLEFVSFSFFPLPPMRETKQNCHHLMLHFFIFGIYPEKKVSPFTEWCTSVLCSDQTFFQIISFSHSNLHLIYLFLSFAHLQFPISEWLQRILLRTLFFPQIDTVVAAIFHYKCRCKSLIFKLHTFTDLS